MTVAISMLRGVNVGGRHKIGMEALRKLYASLCLRNAQTYIQSGNVVFTTDERDLDLVGGRIGTAIERAFGFRPEIVLRTVNQLRELVAGNPFAARTGLDPRKLVVMFPAGDPGAENLRQLLAIEADPEELRVKGRHLYIWFPNGVGRAKLSLALVEKTLKIPATGRNWNTVVRLLAMAEAMETSAQP
jgi:uncharacterized protein (DUF1697 family)